MSEMVHDFFKGMPLYLYIVLLFAIALIVAGFIVPPMGEIHGSVLQGAGIIILGTWLLYTTANIPLFIEKGAKIKAQVGNASIEIGRKKKEENNESEQSREQE